MSMKEAFYLNLSRGLCEIVEGVAETCETCGSVSAGYVAALRAYARVCRSRLDEVSALKEGV